MVVHPLPKPRPIENWRRGWRFWSVRLGALGIVAEFADMANAVLPVWNMLPDDVAAMLPAHTLRLIGSGLWVLALIARFIRQESAHESCP